MHPIKLLIKASTSTAALDTCGRGCKPLFDSIDAAHSLAGLSPVLSAIAYWRFCGDNSQYNKVIGNLAVKAMRHCRENNCGFRMSTITGLCEAAVTQYVQPICPICLGTPVTYPENKDEPVLCGKCNGTGQQQLSIRAIARICKVDKKAIAANHLDTYHALVSHLQESEARIIDHVRKRVDD